MKKSFINILLIGIIVGLLSCSSSKKTYSITDGNSEKIISYSEVTKNTLIGIQDTTIVKISGIILENNEPIDNLKLNFTNTLTKKSHSTTTDFDGTYNIMIENGNYELGIYKTKLVQLDFKSGEVKIVNIDIETDILFETYEIEFNNKREYKKYMRKNMK